MDTMIVRFFHRINTDAKVYFIVSRKCNNRIVTIGGLTSIHIQNEPSFEIRVKNVLAFSFQHAPAGIYRSTIAQAVEARR